MASCVIRVIKTHLHYEEKIGDRVLFGRRRGTGKGRKKVRVGIGGVK